MKKTNKYLMNVSTEQDTIIVKEKMLTTVEDYKYLICFLLIVAITIHPKVTKTCTNI